MRKKKGLSHWKVVKTRIRDKREHFQRKSEGVGQTELFKKLQRLFYFWLVGSLVVLKQDSCSPGWSWTLRVAEDGAEFNLPASIFHAEIRSVCLCPQFLWGAGSGTQGFVNARQAPCRLSYFSSLQPALCIPFYMSPGMDHHPLNVTVCSDQAGVVQKLPHEEKLQWTRI